MTWEAENSPIGWIIVYQTPQGAVWFYPDTYGHIRSIFSSIAGVTLDLQQLARVGDKLKAGMNKNPRFGHRGSETRGDYCKLLCTALNEAGLFPARRAA